MKILITLDFPPEYGGIQKYLYNIVKHTYGCNDIVIVGNKRKYYYHCADIPCNIYFFSTPVSIFNKKFSLIPMIFYFLKIRKRFSGDLYIESGNVYAAIVPFLLSFLFDIRYSVFCYGKELMVLQKKGLKPVLFRSILNKAEKLYHISSYTARLLHEGKVSCNLIHLPPKIEPHIYNNTMFSERPDGVLRLLSVGRLVEHKGHEFLIQAAAQLPEKIKWTLTIAGIGPREKYLESLAKKLNVNEKVIFKISPDNNDLEKEYQKANLFIFPSLETESGTEGFGIVLLEAMAYRLPIVASKVGGIMEVLNNGQYGICVKPGNPDEIKKAILNLVNDSKLREKLIEKAAENLLKYYVWNK